MVDLLRPEPRPSMRQRVANVFSAVTAARVATSAGAVLLVAVTAWWLLRAPAPPVERSLPSARSTVAAGASTSVVSAAPAGSVGPAPPAASGAVPTAIDGTADPPAGTELVVQAAGAVVSPGVYHVPGGARVVDVVTAAGGPAPDADLQAVALAGKVSDGARVYVPRVGEVVTAPPSVAGGVGGSTPATPPPPPIDLNQATVAQLDALPGVGPAIAQAIVDYRSAHGPFASVDDLLEVRGIGPAKLDGFRALVTVG